MERSYSIPQYTWLVRQMETDGRLVAVFETANSQNQHGLHVMDCRGEDVTHPRGPHLVMANHWPQVEAVPPGPMVLR